MRSTFKVLFYLKKNAPQKDGLVPVMGRITINGNIAQFSAKIKVRPSMWDVRAGKAIGKSSEAHQINRILDKIRMIVYKNYLELSEKNTYVTPTQIKNALLGLNEEQETLLKLFAHHNEEFAKKVGQTRALGTYKKYCQVYKHVAQFIKAKLNKTDIFLQELNYQFIQDFDLYLRTEAGCNPTTVWMYTMPLKRMIAVARNKGWLNHNPFIGYRAVPQASTRGFLSVEELVKLMGTRFTKPNQALVRDLFLFSCFTGLSYTDIKNLTGKNLQISFDGHLWVITQRQKTHTPSHIRLLDIPIKIIEKYRPADINQNIFPMPTNSTCNYILKKIAQLSGIKTYLTFHVARHTFATTVTLSQGVPIETVSQMLGHTSIKTTQIYARITHQKISQDMEILSHKLKKMKDWKQ